MRNRLSYANVTATIALFLALTGGAVWAAGKFQSRDIARNGVTAKNLAKGAVKGRAIATNAVKTKAIKPLPSTARSWRTRPCPRRRSPPARSPSRASAPWTLSGSTSFTPTANDVYMLVASGRGTFGDVVAGSFCGLSIDFPINGQEVEDIFLGSDGTATLKPDQDGDEETLSLPAGQPANLTASAEVFTGCRPSSAAETVRVAVVRFPGP